MTILAVYLTLIMVESAPMNPPPLSAAFNPPPAYLNILWRRQCPGIRGRWGWSVWGHSNPEEYGASRQAAGPFGKKKVIFLWLLVRESVWMCDRRVFPRRGTRVHQTTSLKLYMQILSLKMEWSGRSIIGRSNWEIFANRWRFPNWEAFYMVKSITDHR